MEQRTGNSGLDLVLDNRKLIVAFGVLILLCGTFFVIGFMEGKRQGLAAGERFAAAAPTPNAASAPAQTVSEKKPIEDQSVREKLDWYNNVSKRDEPEAKLVPPESHPAAPEKPAEANVTPAKPAIKPEKPLETPSKTTFSVQIGAYHQRREAENKAAELKSKGYPFFIEAPSAAHELYLLKVGRFESRADAAGMESKLKKHGFPCFVKAN